LVKVVGDPKEGQVIAATLNFKDIIVKPLSNHLNAAIFLISLALNIEIHALKTITLCYVFEV